MSPVIRVTPEVYSRLEKYAVGFDNPSNVIEKLLDNHEGQSNEFEEKGLHVHKMGSFAVSKKRLFTNKEIQKRISDLARNLSSNELEKLCNEQTSKNIFGISFPLFIRVPSTANQARKRSAVKSNDGVNRWTWKFEFVKEGYAYAICTQWYPKNDALVQKWIQQYE